MQGFERSVTTLEFDKIRELLCEKAVCDGAKKMALELVPETRADRVRTMLKNTSDAKAVSAQKGAPSFAAVHDVSDALERADKGATLSARELLDIAALLRCATAKRLCERSEHQRR